MPEQISVNRKDLGPERVFRSSLAGSPGVLWKIDARRSHGEAATSHPLWGRRSSKLLVVDGEILEGDEQLDVTMRLAFADVTDEPLSNRPSPGARLAAFQGNRIEPADIFRFQVSGQLQLGDQSRRVSFRVHDLGWIDQSQDVRRWTLTASSALERKYWSCAGAPGGRAWLTSRLVDVFLHLECVDTLPVAPAA